MPMAMPPLGHLRDAETPSLLVYRLSLPALFSRLTEVPQPPEHSH